MPKLGDIDALYPQKLADIGLRIVGPFCGSKKHHNIQCLLCDNIFNATPISKLQNFKKHGIAGCPACSDKQKYEQVRASNIQKLKDRGIEVLTDWDGTTGKGKESTAIMLTVRNTKCGHAFQCTSKNLLTRNVNCGVCGPITRVAAATAWSKANSEEWAKTADIWKRYKATVMNLTRKTYRKHKETINPTNLPFGIAGTDGAYHLDHIVPIRYCFEHYVPPEAVADVSNLQMLPWEENLTNKSRLKHHIPQIVNKYLLI